MGVGKMLCAEDTAKWLACCSTDQTAKGSMKIEITA